MNTNTLWSLRLGFSGKQSNTIEQMGLSKFLDQSFNTSYDKKTPSFLDNSPKSLKVLKAKRQEIKASNPDNVKELLKAEIQVQQEMKAWWIQKMIADEFPLREKMTCFWHNHFVCTFQKVKVNHWIFQHNQLLRENAFGNFKTLTKKVIQSNAMVRYLDNVDNKREKINENLSRELLELFTLGIGNYTEEDIKNGAKGLAGLNIGEDKAEYRRFLENNDTITYFGKTGTFKADQMIDIIFEQKAIPYLITKKILQWFIYDNPKSELVTYYGDYFRKVDFEIKPLLTKIFTEEFKKSNTGSKIKDPLVYILQLMNELNAEKLNPKLLAFYLKQQGMDLFNQPNVKGWNGGKEWISSQVYLQRNNTADLLCNGRNISRKAQMTDNDMVNDNINQLLKVSLKWNKSGTNKTIITELQERLLFHTDENLQKDWEAILKYDFNPQAEGADNAVMRLFNNMVKTPEFSNHIVMNRRNFLSLTGTFTAGTLLLPDFLHAFGSQTNLVIGEQCLVFIQLNGGNDGLNTFIPYENPLYYDLRSKIALSKDVVLSKNKGMAFHPALKDFAAMQQNGDLTIIQNVGYPEPNRSHFRSQEIWQTATASNEYLSNGWLGRYLDLQCKEHQPTAGVNFDNIDNLSLKGNEPNAITVKDPNRFKIKSNSDDAVKLSDNPQLDFVRKIAYSVSEGSDDIQKALAKSTSEINYPKTGLGKNLEWIARLIKGDLNSKVYYTSQNGYDTHDNQINIQQRNLTELNDAIFSFYTELKKAQLLQNVTLVVFSEFGRRVKDNGNGTDHGTAAPMFIIGGNNKGKIIGNNPNLADLDNGDLKYEVDFRSVYASLLQNKMNFDYTKIGITNKTLNGLF